VRGLAAMEEWIAGRSDVDWSRPDGGIIAFVRLRDVEDTTAFAAELRERRGVNVAEGEFFRRPGWIRVGVGGPEETVREGLRRLGEALDERS